ncbi:MAG TPA: hypothetical protein VN786_13040 [Acidimicrobiales bacterium]|nr:hypothetical protein [Acidimicrobiales bacterium]
MTDVTEIDNTERALRAAAVGFACAAAFGAAVAIRDDLPGEPLGIRVPLTVPTGLLVGWGAAVAAPWPMPVAALMAASRASGRHGDAGPALVCAGLGIAGIVGILIEPLTYKPKSWTATTRAAVLVHVAASVALAATGLRRWKSSRRIETA